MHYAALRTIGFDNVDLEAAERLGIRISHAAYSPYSVANYTVILMLMCIRKAVYIMFRSHTADCSLGMARGMEMQNLTVGDSCGGAVASPLFSADALQEVRSSAQSRSVKSVEIYSVFFFMINSSSSC